jgi:hypothetical protein
MLSPKELMVLAAVMFVMNVFAIVVVLSMVTR